MTIRSGLYPGGMGRYDDPLEAEVAKLNAEAELAEAKKAIIEENEELLREANEMTRWDPSR
jgi:hypothetical protein